MRKSVKKGNKVCFIYPGISWSGFDTFGRKKCGECNFIHHGIASMSAVLEDDGIEVEFLDLRKLKGWSDFKKRIKISESNIYGISSTTVDFGYAIKCAKLIKKIRPESCVVVGGVHATLCPKDALKNKCFDFVVVGEGETAMKKIIEQKVEKGKKPDRLIQGEPIDLQKIPFIDRDLFDHRNGEMINPFVADLKTPFTTIMSSRGCPFNCTFCQPAERMVFGGRVRLREISDVVNELKSIKEKYGLNSFMIHDDLFIINSERINEFVRLYRRANIGAEFICQGRADLIVRMEKDLEKLKEIGLKGIMIGFESGSQRVLDFLHKGTTVEQNIKAASICKRLGIKIWANYMLGIPGEKWWEVIKTLRMMKRIKPDYHSPSLFTPYPETELYEYCKKNDLLIFSKYDQYRRSLKGDKIKGVNYPFIRFMLFWYMPLSSKMAVAAEVGKMFFSKN